MKPKETPIRALSGFLKNANMSPRKIGIIADAVRNMNVEKALISLAFSQKKGAKIIYKLLASSLANAKNFGKDSKNLVIESILVGPGNKLRRVMPRARGRSGLILKRLTNIRIQLKEDLNQSSRKRSRQIASNLKDQTEENMKNVEEVEVNEELLKEIPEESKGLTHDEGFSSNSEILDEELNAEEVAIEQDNIQKVMDREDNNSQTEEDRNG